MPLLPRARVSLVVVAFLAFGPAYGRAQSSATQPLHGAAVTPRVVEFSALPRITAPYTGVVRVREEAINPEADSVLSVLKRNPLPLGPSELGNLTIDSRKRGYEMLAPAIGTGFEGITQAGLIHAEPTVAGGPLNIFTAGNVSVTVTNKDGSNRVETDGQAFFGIPAAEGPISDAQCYYDALRGRFVA